MYMYILYMCAYIYIHICMQIQMFVHMYIHMCSFLCIYVYMYLYICMFIHHIQVVVHEYTYL